tara:strand:- start:748 stop:1401 length:654 start_codon:yes stop_codon:yes gene_type:complete
MEKNGCGKDKCKYHFGAECFKTVAEVKAFISPNKVGQTDYVHSGALFDILLSAWFAFPDADEFPDEDYPDMFVLEHRQAPGERPHLGWQPDWQQYEVETNIRFSFRHLFTPNSGRDTRLKILRGIVRSQIEDVRSGVEGHTHVHHEPPFIEVVDEWLIEEDIALSDLVITRDDEGYQVLAEQDLAESWEVYHAHNTTLTALTEAEHWERHREMKQEI